MSINSQTARRWAKFNAQLEVFLADGVITSWRHYRPEGGKSTWELSGRDGAYHLICTDKLLEAWISGVTLARSVYTEGI